MPTTCADAAIVDFGRRKSKLCRNCKTLTISVRPPQIRPSPNSVALQRPPEIPVALMRLNADPGRESGPEEACFSADRALALMLLLGTGG